MRLLNNNAIHPVPKSWTYQRIGAFHILWLPFNRRLVWGGRNQKNIQYDRLQVIDLRPAARFDDEDPHGPLCPCVQHSNERLAEYNRRNHGTHQS